MQQLSSHFQYLKYVLRHKWFVFQAGLKTGASIWRLLKHDWTKFLFKEWSPYVASFYGPWKYNERPIWVREAFDAAWLHHQHWNDHHWQHWILREDSGGVKILEMPYEAMKEMVADWAGAGRAITGKWEIEDWYQKNKDKILLHPDTRIVVESLLKEVVPKTSR